MPHRNNNKDAEIFGWAVSILLTIVLFIVFVSVPIFLNFGVVYLLSLFPIVEFHFYSDFWSNFRFFLGFTILNITVLVLSELFIAVNRKSKVAKLSDIGPKNFKEWIFYLLIFTVYINIFDIFFDRLETTIIGSGLISLGIVFLVIVIEKYFNRFHDEEED
ncbi:hypothetical protein [Ornithinibacillus scapharcae]|uniref:hypothetical protein n=1 Tax=Ornithinibacillus scapharcae TaxID=1147159 RepID=UPI000225B830|nr:hypothetical protein [Ornithinibacillus scapharcae]